MFGSKKSKKKLVEKNSNSSSSQQNNGDTSVIIPGTKIEGTITTSENIRMDGTIIGKLDCKRKLVLGISGLIDGEAICDSSNIEGKVKGKIQTKETMRLLSTANIEGDIYAGKMIVDAGAKYKGFLNIGDIETGNPT